MSDRVLPDAGRLQGVRTDHPAPIHCGKSVVQSLQGGFQEYASGERYERVPNYREAQDDATRRGSRRAMVLTTLTVMYKIRRNVNTMTSPRHDRNAHDCDGIRAVDLIHLHQQVY